MISALHALGERVANTALSLTIREAAWIVPAVQTIHIVCVAIVISAVFLVDLRILGAFAPAQPLASVARRFLPWIWYALVVLLITGTLLIVGEPARSLTNPAFALKMTMLVAVALLTTVIQRPLTINSGYWDESAPRRGVLKGIAVVSLVLWSAIVFAGRWIAYVASW